MFKALITGITGMAGSHLADFLLAYTTWDVYGMCRWRSPLDNVQHLLDRVNRKDRIFFVDGDLGDSVSLQKVINETTPDYVFHLAAQSYPKASASSPFQTLDTNILGTMRLLEVIKSCKEIKPVILICSSAAMYGAMKDNLPISEDCALHPSSLYAISKIGTDMIGRFYAEAYGLKTIITRMSTHTGPRRGDVFVDSSFAKQIAMIENGLISPVIKVGNLDSCKIWLDVRDVVRAYYLLVIKNTVPGEYYNISGIHYHTIEEMLNYLISISTHKNVISVETDQTRVRPLETDFQVPDMTKFTKYTGWKPVIPFEKTMKDLLEYWRDKIFHSGGSLIR